MSTIPSDLPGPVPAPTGPTEGAIIADVPEAPASVVVNNQPPSEPSIVGAPEVAPPPVVAGDGEVVLSVESPWYTENFNSSLAGAPVISRKGTAVPSSLADQVISIGAANGVTITKR